MFQSNRLIIALLFSFKAWITVESFPTVAGHCNAGDAIKGGHGSVGSGFLSAGDYALNVNDSPVMQGSTTTLEPGVDHLLTLRAVKTGTTFKGFMFRMSKGGVDTSSVLSVVDDVNSRTNPQCYGPNSVVASICHNHRDPKTSVVVKLRVDAPIDLLLDLTVVEDNTGGGSNLWYYSSYNFDMQATPSPTLSPTASPSAFPSVKKEDPYDKFYYKSTGNGKVITKTCLWLSKRNKATQHKICHWKKRNEDYGPASEVCMDTCAPYPCRPDRKKGKFVWKVKGTKTIMKTCQWLEKQNKRKKVISCKRTTPKPVASQVCLTTCCKKKK